MSIVNNSHYAIDGCNGVRYLRGIEAGELKMTDTVEVFYIRALLNGGWEVFDDLGAARFIGTLDRCRAWISKHGREA